MLHFTYKNLYFSTIKIKCRIIFPKLTQKNPGHNSPGLSYQEYKKVTFFVLQFQMYRVKLQVLH